MTALIEEALPRLAMNMKALTARCETLSEPSAWRLHGNYKLLGLIRVVGCLIMTGQYLCQR